MTTESLRLPALRVERKQFLLHQIDFAKLAADISAAVISTLLLWRGQVRTGLIVNYLVPIAASAVLLRRDLSALRSTRRGRFVLTHMTPARQGVRLVGDTIVVVGALRRSACLVIFGVGTVLAGWFLGVPHLRIEQAN